VEESEGKSNDSAPSSARAIWTLIAVETLCMLGAEIARFGITVWIYATSHSVGAFSALLVANLVPGMVAHPIAGSYVDRKSRKAVMIVAALVTMIGSAIVFAGALVGELSLPIVIAGSALASIGDAFQWPALAATIPLMASEDDLPAYNGFVESGHAIGRFAGPAIGGFLIAFTGVTWLVAIEVATFVLAMVVVAGMHLPDPEPEEDDEGGLVSDMLFGFKWIWSHRPMLKFLLVATFANFFLAVGEVVSQPYGLTLLSERAYGIVNAMFGAGMIVGGLVCGLLADRFSNLQQFLGSAFVVGLAYVAFGFSRDPYTFGAIEFAIAAMMTIANASIMTIWQLKVPEAQQGRVFSAMQTVADVMTPLAFLLAAPLAEHAAPAMFDRLRGASVWGSSPGAVMGSLFTTMGVLLVAGFALAATVRDIRRIESTE
jgi:MFS family permease